MQALSTIPLDYVKVRSLHHVHVPMCCIRTTLATRAFSSLPWEGSGLLAAWDALWARLGAARPRLLGFRQCNLTNPVEYLGFVRSMRIDETEIAISAMGRPRDDLCLAVPLLEPRLVPKPARAEASRREYRHSNGSEAEPLPVQLWVVARRSLCENLCG